MSTKSTKPVSPVAEQGDSPDHRPTIDASGIDALSLEQALRDFEVANVRVVDLTGRLTAMHQQMLELQHKSSLAHLQLAATIASDSQLMFERDAAREEVALLRASRSYRIGNLLVRIIKMVTP